MRAAFLLVGLLCACGARSAGDLLDDDALGAGGASGGKSSVSGGPGKGGNPGFGGAPGGSPGAGGAPGRGGAPGVGGAPGRGGAPSPGGAPGFGGAPGGSPGFGSSPGLGGAPAGGQPAIGGAGAGGVPTVPDPVACTSLCTTIFSTCPIPDTDTTTCTLSCIGDLQQQTDACHELQRNAMTCVEKALSTPFASCDTVALAIALQCRDALSRAAMCRQ